MRSRVIKPEFWSDEKLSKVSRELRLFFVGLWCVADDQGVTHSGPSLLRSQLFPYDEKLRTSHVQMWINKLIELGMLIPYTAENGENYLFIKGFSKHQKIDHPSKTQFNPTPREGLASLREDYGKVPLQTEYKQKLIKTEDKVSEVKLRELKEIEKRIKLSTVSTR